LKALVLGKGVSGTAAGAALEADGAEVSYAEGVDLVVASPGVRVKSELQFGVERLRALGVKALAVTGSKGKSSVVKLVADAISATGAKAVPCGNYGLPVSAVGGDADWAVVEVSSFQMETTNLPPDAFEAATVLNLQEDHIDRHGSVAAYHAAKMRLLGMAKRIVEPRGDERDAALFAGSYFDNAILRANAFAAVGLMCAAGLDDPQIAAAFRGFRPLPHRMQTVFERGGTKFVDDSKATSVAALAAGVEMAGGKVRLIAGGLAKGDDPKSAIEVLTKRVEKVYLIGNCANAFRDAWVGSVDCMVCGDMASAVRAAAAEAQPGETVLLSPGAASFDQYGNFEERGNDFADLAKKEGQKKT